MTLPVELVHVSIRRPAAEVSAFASDPKNMPSWASGVSKSSLKPEGKFWITDSPMGKVKIQFAEKNSFGVLDHDVTLPDGTTVHNPLRVQPNGEGAEVIFTLYRQPKVSDSDFKSDETRVRADLEKLKSILEGKG